MVEAKTVRTATYLCASLLAAISFPVAFAGEGASCFYETDPNAIPVGNFYVQGLGSYWEESNGIPGLQDTPGGCNDGTTIPRDSCIVYETAVLQCTLTYGPGRCLVEYLGNDDLLPSCP